MVNTLTLTPALTLSLNPNPNQVRHVPNSQYAGVRCGAAARLGIGAFATGWAGLRVEGRVILELGCGTGAVGLACAHLGASEVWCTDTDADALGLAARNAAANGATTVRVVKLDMQDEAEAARPEGKAETASLDRSDGTPRHFGPDGTMPRRFGLVLAANLVYSGAATALLALKAAARYVDRADPQARVLCCFGQEQRPGEQRPGAAPTVEELDLAVAAGTAPRSSVEASQFMEAFEDGCMRHKARTPD